MNPSNAQIPLKKGKPSHTRRILHPFFDPTAFWFSCRNRHTQPGRTMLFFAFFLVISAASFIFIGELYQYKDDTLTKIYENSAYYNEDMTRLAVSHKDGSEITEEDVAQINSLANVVCVDSCEYCNDINYYMEKGTDYKLTYYEENGEYFTDEYVYTFLNEDHFMRSASCIDTSDLATGDLPEELTEIVVYSDDASVIGTTVKVLFTAPNLWGRDEYCTYDMTISGILKEDADQVYFSTAFCEMLGAYMDADQFWQYAYNSYYGKWLGTFRYIPIVKEDLIGYEVRTGLGRAAVTDLNRVNYSEMTFRYTEADEHDETTSASRFEQYMVLSGNASENSTGFLEVSSYLFYQYYRQHSTQAAVYISHYAMTDSVLNKLTDMGYFAISTYRVSVDEYNSRLVSSRIYIIGLSICGLLVLALAEILIMSAMMRIRMKDARILKSIGMRIGMIHRISYYEMLAHCLAAMLTAVICIQITRLAGVELIDEMMWYMRWHSYALFFIYNIGTCVLMVMIYNHSLRKKLIHKH